MISHLGDLRDERLRMIFPIPPTRLDERMITQHYA